MELPFYLLSFLYLFLSFLYPFLCTSLHSALSGVESGASCATTEGMTYDTVNHNYACTVNHNYVLHFTVNDLSEKMKHVEDLGIQVRKY